LLNGFAQMSADATYGAAATAFNTKVDAALALSQTTGNAGGTFAAAGVAPVSGGAFTLTTGTDIADEVSAARGSLASTFKFTSGNESVTGSVGTLSQYDVLVDGSTKDQDVLTVSLNGASGAFTAQNIETINANFVAGSSQALNLSNVSGVNTVGISGSAAGEVNGFAADTVQPTIALSGYTRALTVAPADLRGTAALSTAEAINLSVSGATYGTTAATQTSVTIDPASTNNGVLETLNIASVGSTSNEFLLTMASSNYLDKVNVSGTAPLTIRGAAADLSGVSVASTSTGATTVAVDVNGTSTGTSVNGANIAAGVNLAVFDSTAGSDEASIASVKSGATISLLNDFDASFFTVQGATDTAAAAALTITLDNAKAATDVDVTSIDVQNVKALTINSNGYTTSTSETGVNSIGSLVSDATTITISGDTSLSAELAIDNAYSATVSSGAARAVTVSAAGMTGGFVNLTSAGGALVTYTITGSAYDDIISSNNNAATLNGGAGADTLTGGNGNDTISGGDGNDTVNVSYGTDAVTLGAGDDLIDINSTGTAIARQVTNTSATLATALTTGTTMYVTIGGLTYAETWATDDDTTLDAFVTHHAAQILALNGVTVTSTPSTATALSFQGAATGAAFTVGVRTINGGTPSTSSANTGYIDAVSVSGTAASTGLDVNTTITDFATGDVINTEGLTNLGTGGYWEQGTDDAYSAAAAYGVVVLTGASYADVTAASTAVNVLSSSNTAGLVVFLNSTTGKAEAYYDDLLDTDAVSGAATSKVFTFDNITTLTGLATVLTADSFVI
jgi:hypothetical protein